MEAKSSETPSYSPADAASVPEVALAHHWLVGMRGGEKVLEEFSALFPSAPIYTLVARPSRLSAALRRHRIFTSLLGSVPRAWRFYKQTLPFFPWLIGTLRVRGRPALLLSSDASLIKGLRVPEGVTHICYCHSPPRYLWDQQEAYNQAAGFGAVGRSVLRAITPYLRRWDRRAAQRVDYFIANSEFVKERIKTAYGKDAVVIHPPVAIDDFRTGGPHDDFYLIVSQIVPYKRIDLAVAAFNQLGKRLIIIGEGSELAALQRIARDNITFLGAQPFAALQDHYQRCRAFIFPGLEDFGITPLEAQASGRPVIAFRAGGALETVVEGETGLFFDRQHADDLAEAVRQFETREWDSNACRKHAARFAPERFRKEILSFLDARGFAHKTLKSLHEVTPPRLRVAIVSEPGKAGVKTHVMDILQNIDVARFEVAYFYSMRRRDQDYATEIEGLRSRGIVCHEIPMDVKISPFDDLRAFLRLRSHLLKFRPAVLHLHSSKAGGIGRLVSVTYTPHPCVIYTPNAMACYWSSIYLFMERLLGLFTSVLVAASNSEKDDFVRWKIPHARQSAALTVGVRNPKIVAKPRANGPWTIGACGRICFQKNSALFFRSAVRLLESNPDIHFRWIGDFADDEEAAEVRHILAEANRPDRIHVTGWVSDPQQQVAQLDIFCMFSRYESFGYVTADAMLLGVPVLATPSTGTDDLIIDGETGLTVSPTVEQVVAGWMRLRDDEALRHRLVANALHLVSTTHTIAQMSAEMEQIYLQGGGTH